jgi:hypothetical protein
MREFLNKYGLITGIVLLVLAGVVLFAFYRKTEKQFGPDGFFVDETTGEEFIMPRSKYPPQPDKNGKPNVVGVFKFSCDRGKTVQVGYYYKYNEATKQKLDGGKGEADPNFASLNGMLIRKPEKGSPWVPWNSEEAIPIRTSLACPKGELETVFP